MEISRKNATHSIPKVKLNTDMIIRSESPEDLQKIRKGNIEAFDRLLLQSVNASFHFVSLSSNARCNTAFFVLSSFIAVSLVFFIFSLLWLLFVFSSSISPKVD